MKPWIMFFEGWEKIVNELINIIKKKRFIYSKKHHYPKKIFFKGAGCFCEKLNSIIQIQYFLCYSHPIHKKNPFQKAKKKLLKCLLFVCSKCATMSSKIYIFYYCVLIHHHSLMDIYIKDKKY